MTISRASALMVLLHAMLQLTPETTAIIGDDIIAIPGMKAKDHGVVLNIEEAGMRDLIETIEATIGTRTVIAIGIEIEIGIRTETEAMIRSELVMRVKVFRNTIAGGWERQTIISIVLY